MIVDGSYMAWVRPTHRVHLALSVGMTVTGLVLAAAGMTGGGGSARTSPTIGRSAESVVGGVVSGDAGLPAGAVPPAPLVRFTPPAAPAAPSGKPHPNPGVPGRHVDPESVPTGHAAPAEHAVPEHAVPEHAVPEHATPAEHTTPKHIAPVVPAPAAAPPASSKPAPPANSKPTPPAASKPAPPAGSKPAPVPAAAPTPRHATHPSDVSRAPAASPAHSSEPSPRSSSEPRRIPSSKP